MLHKSCRKNFQERVVISEILQKLLKTSETAKFLPIQEGIQHACSVAINTAKVTWELYRV